LPQVKTTLIGYQAKNGTGARGPWTLHLYTDAAGQSYRTFEAPISNRVYGLLNQPVVLTYEEKPARDPQYPPNRVIQDVQQDLSFPAAPVAPVAAQAAPALPPTTPPAPVGGGADDRQVQIMRQSALERAIRWIDVLGVAAYEGDDPYALTEEFLHYFQTGEYPGKAVGPASGASQNEQAVVDEFADVFGA
jgi:hypothetical protein